MNVIKTCTFKNTENDIFFSNDIFFQYIMSTGTINLLRL